MSYIICPNCKFKTLSGYVLCKHCGKPLPGAVLPVIQNLSLTVLDPNGESQPSSSLILSPITISIGRTPDNSIVLADKEASRHHAAIFQDKDGNHCVEDLHSTNGTFLNGSRLIGPARVTNGDKLRIGTTDLQFGNNSGTIMAIASMPFHPELTIISVGKQSCEEPLNAVAADQTHGENFRPLARAGWALKHIQEDDDYYVLKSLQDSVYIKLNERDVHLWKLMDGQHTLRDILIDYLKSYQALGADRLIDLVDELAEKGFLQNAAPRQPPAPSSDLRSRFFGTIRKIGAFFFQKQFPLQGVDDRLTRLYTHFAWRFYTRTGQVVLAAIALFGFAAFISILFQGDYSLFKVQGSVIWGILFLGLANTISIFLHEIGHALTAKSYHRQVRRVGFMIYFGMPTFFVDTSDIWMEPKGPRIQTSLAGPYVSFLVGSITSLVMLVSGSPLFNAILFKLAAWSFIVAFFNLNPLLELDGYFILMDILEIPQLRKQSLQFVRSHLIKKLWGRQVFSKEEQLFALFGSLSAIWSVIAIGLFFFYEAPSIIAILHGNLEGVTTLITLVLLVGVPGLFILLDKRRKNAALKKSGEGNN